MIKSAIIRSMSKFSTFTLLVLFLFTMIGVSQAADTFQLNPLNVQGDTVYLPKTNSFGVGVGSNIAIVKDILELRGMVVTSVDKQDANMFGVGLGINLPKIIKKAGGVWLLDKVNPSIGVTGLVNVNGKAHIVPAIYISVVSVSY